MGKRVIRNVGVPASLLEVAEEILDTNEKFSRMRSSKVKARYIATALFNKLAEEIASLGEDENVALRGLGTFRVVTHKRTKFFNPKTGEPVERAPRKLLKFRSHGKMKASINP